MKCYWDCEKRCQRSKFLYCFASVTEEASPDVMTKSYSPNNNKSEDDRDLDCHSHGILISTDVSSSQFIWHPCAVKTQGVQCVYVYILNYFNLDSNSFTMFSVDTKSITYIGISALIFFYSYHFNRVNIQFTVKPTKT